MTLEDLGNIGEVVGGVGVAVSLLYLAVQIRQNSRIASFNAHQSTSDSVTGVLASLAKDPELYRIWRAVFYSAADASDDDRERFGMILHQIFTTFDNADRFAEFDPSLRHRTGSILDRFLRAPAVQEWWSRQREVHAEPFRSRVDARLRELASTTQAGSSSSPAA